MNFKKISITMLFVAIHFSVHADQDSNGLVETYKTMWSEVETKVVIIDWFLPTSPANSFCIDKTADGIPLTFDAQSIAKFETGLCLKAKGSEQCKDTQKIEDRRLLIREAMFARCVSLHKRYSGTELADVTLPVDHTQKDEQAVARKTWGFKSKIDLNKTLQFLASKDACSFAMTATIAGYPISSEVLCVWNGVFGEGTVHETKGCFVGAYNLANGKYRNVMDVKPTDEQEDALFTEEPCSKQTVSYLVATPFSKLFQKRARFWDYPTDLQAEKSLAEVFGDIVARNIGANLDFLKVEIVGDKFGVLTKDLMKMENKKGMRQKRKSKK